MERLLRAAPNLQVSRQLRTKQMSQEKLDLIAERARIRHLKARNLLILEAAIAALLDTETPQEAATILREHADLLVQYF
ncbi:hypothetical protein DKP76_16370 [Falsochrobactrum shanghaiense]|uniref:Uncharacterized protein n=2 Tax=Falsochrobactrum shanghaiense TaxID=2201899 RepID=A0A316J598_9HYPH|nr:hypothetical protein DKP76_16370 [Falsochrobactrum shanghaiense]